MGKHVTFDPISGTTTIETIPDELEPAPPAPVIQPPTAEERIAAVEATLLEILLGG